MSLRELERRCTDVLSDVQVPRPLDVPLLIDRIAAHRGRPIFLRYCTRPAGHSGLTLMLGSADVIFVEEQTSDLHRQHIALHELGHLLLNHTRGLNVADAPGR